MLTGLHGFSVSNVCMQLLVFLLCLWDKVQYVYSLFPPLLENIYYDVGQDELSRHETMKSGTFPRKECIRKCNDIIPAFESTIKCGGILDVLSNLD